MNRALSSLSAVSHEIRRTFPLSQFVSNYWSIAFSWKNNLNVLNNWIRITNFQKQKHRFLNLVPWLVAFNYVYSSFMLLLLIIYSQIYLFTFSEKKCRTGVDFLLNIAEIIWKVETNVLRAQTKTKTGLEVKQKINFKIRMWIFYKINKK